MATIRIPAQLRSYTRDTQEISVSGKTVREALGDLDRLYPGIGARLLDEKGNVRRYVNIFHNDEDIRFLKELDTPVSDADRISIVPAIAGGAAL
jgi:MoaD family protein